MDDTEYFRSAFFFSSVLMDYFFFGIQMSLYYSTPFHYDRKKKKLNTLQEIAWV